MRPAFHFKRLPARGRSASCAQPIEIERHASSPTVWTAFRRSNGMHCDTNWHARRAALLPRIGTRSHGSVACPVVTASGRARMPCGATFAC
ncbi:hypothetical protein D1006_07180 [Burkholderia stabilis]|uniref:Uncharacterized protein n=1 Tax=Burkholderia stabilis TaxID=95485 RepID=A0A4Q2AQ03_9BURK|nr:hypothetical protein D1006_07180 [Burkholderia stabilis]